MLVQIAVNSNRKIMMILTKSVPEFEKKITFIYSSSYCMLTVLERLTGGKISILFINVRMCINTEWLAHV
jgi:hypothetical protein